VTGRVIGYNPLPMSDTVLVLGSGAREHAILRALARSPRDPELVCAPGNPGIAQLARVVSDVDIEDPEAVLALARETGATLVVVGPEAPLVAGVADALAAESVPCVGPGREAARLEGSKAFCKEIMRAAGVPTAGHAVVTDPDAGMAAVDRYPVVIKADGLAAGKGVIIATDPAQARAAFDELLVHRRFDTDSVLVEEFLEGEELSLLALCDGVRALPLASARDYKPLGDGDAGPNTGGMGAFSPVPGIDEAATARFCAAIHQPVLDEMARRGSPFTGILYAGLMLTAAGPRVLEFNARFGDPETQAILPRLRTDLLGLLQATTRPDGLARMTVADLEWDPRTAVTVVLAADGYPQQPRSGDPIVGLDAVDDAVEVTHAGTARSTTGEIVTSGGRVLSVTALGEDAAAARIGAYEAANTITFAGRQMRSDVAVRRGDDDRGA
jgi:phosphoribosylamine--glycine ligase